MGHSNLDPAMHERRPSNVERNDGYKLKKSLHLLMLSTRYQRHSEMVLSKHAGKFSR